MSGQTTTSGHIPRVRLFRAMTYDKGTPDEVTYSVADLDAIIRNYWLLCHGPGALYQPVIGIGHEDNSEVPAAGVAQGLWREGRDLWGSLGEIPVEVHDWMQRGLLQSVSVELYDSPEQANIPPELARGATGPMLRKVSLLGAHPPRAKLGRAAWKFGEVATTKGRIISYGLRPSTAEKRTVNRDQMMQLAKKAGLPQPFLDSLSDEQLAMLVLDMAQKALGGGGGGAADAPGAPPPTETAAEMPSREQMIAELVQMGQDQATLEALDDAALAELYQQLKGPGGAAATTQMGERNVGRKAAAVPAVGLSLHTVRQVASATAQATVAKERGEERKKRIQEFVASRSKAGKIAPAQVEATTKRLERASAVQKFGEGPSELEQQMAEIDAAPAAFARLFGDKMPDPSGKSGDDSVVEQAKAYAANRNKRRA